MAIQRRIECSRCGFRGRTRVIMLPPCPTCGAALRETTAARGRPRKTVAERLRDEVERMRAQADALAAIADELDMRTR